MTVQSIAESLTPEQAGKKLRVDRRHVLALIHGGQLSATNIAARPDGMPRWRISLDAIEAFLAARTKNVPQSAGT